MHDDACFLQDSLAFHKCGQDWPSISECHRERLPGQLTLPQTVFNGICDRGRNDSWQLRLHGVIQASDSIQQIGQMEHLYHKIFLKKSVSKIELWPQNVHRFTDMVHVFLHVGYLWHSSGRRFNIVTFMAVSVLVCR